MMLIFKFTDIATDTTSDLLNFSYKMKDKILNVFTVDPSLPNKEMVKGDVSSEEMVGDNVAEMISSKTVTSQDLVTDIGQGIQSPEDSKTVITTITDNKPIIILPESKTVMSQPLEI